MTPQRKAEIDALIASQKQRTPQPAAPSGLTPERKAQIDAMIAQQKAQKAQPVEQPKKPNLLQSLSRTPLRAATNVLNFAEGAGRLISGQAIGDSARRSRDFGAFGQDIRPIGVSEQGQFKNVGNFAKDVAGSGAELASYAAPAGLLGRGATVGAKIASGAKAGAVGGAMGGFGSGLQKDQSFGKTVAQTAGGALFGGFTGGALPVAGAVGNKIVQTAGKIGGEILGQTTGAGEAAIREAFNNPNVVRFARKAGKEGPEELMTQALEDAQRGLRKLKSSRGKAYEGELTKIKADKTQLDGVLQDARQVGRDLLRSSGVKVKEGKLLNTLNFDESTIERGQGTVQKAFNDVMKWRDVTPAGLDKLKKKLQQHLDEIPATERGGAFNFVLELKDAISNRLKTDVKGYANMTSKYSEASDLIDEIQRALSLKETAAKDTAVRKLMSTMRQNNELRLELLQALGEATGKDITGKIAGATLVPWTPRGLAAKAQSVVTPTGLAVSFFSAKAIPFLLLYLATASPRLMAEAVTLLGKSRGKMLSPQIQSALRNLLIQATRETSTQ